MNPDALRAHAWFALLTGCVALCFEGAFIAAGNGVGFVLTLACTASAATMWCVVDSLRRGKYWHRAAQWYTFLFWPLAVPVYLVWSRGYRGIWFALAYLVILLALPMVVSVAAALLS